MASQTPAPMPEADRQVPIPAFRGDVSPCPLWWSSRCWRSDKGMLHSDPDTSKVRESWTFPLCLPNLSAPTPRCPNHAAKILIPILWIPNPTLVLDRHNRNQLRRDHLKRPFGHSLPKISVGRPSRGRREMFHLVWIEVWGGVLMRHFFSSFVLTEAVREV